VLPTQFAPRNVW